MLPRRIVETLVGTVLTILHLLTLPSVKDLRQEDESGGRDFYV